RLAKEGTPEEREEACRHLAPFISEAARKVARSKGWGKRDQENFADEAPSVILEKLQAYDPARPFKPWLYKVLLNWIVDEKRKRKTRQKHVGVFSDILDRKADSENKWARVTTEAEVFADSHSLEDYSQAEIRVDLSTPFSEADLEKLERGLKPRPRVFSLVILGLWDCVPRARWESWLQQAELSPDFPPQEITQHDDYNDRLRELARLPGATEQSFRMLLSRAREVFWSLKKIQELGET
uniref:hypothetical protein n=1 Tax=Thermogutta sp. TaxID=1962930 RepID=UPI00321FA9C6